MSPSKSTAVVACPSTPASGGIAVVTSGGRRSCFVHQIRYSALTQYRPGGPHGRGPVQPAMPAIGLACTPPGVGSHGAGPMPMGGKVVGVPGAADLSLAGVLSPVFWEVGLSAPASRVVVHPSGDSSVLVARDGPSVWHQAAPPPRSTARTDPRIPFLM